MKKNNIGQRLLSVLLVLSLMCVTSVAVLAAEEEKIQKTETMEVNRIASGTTVYDGYKSLKEGLGFWSDSFDVPEAGVYRVTYSIMTEPSNNIISFYVANNIDLGRVDVQKEGSMRGSFNKYLNKGTAYVNVHLSMPMACGISVIVSKV